jgi:SAM-dependent methyltransferase
MDCRVLSNCLMERGQRMSKLKISNILDYGLIYELWQRPFSSLKMEPVRRHNVIGEFRRVLDVACGPATNTQYFQNAEYLGFDLNPKYIERAKSLAGDRFVVANALEFVPPPAFSHFDCILANSFFHHMNDEDTLQILRQLAGLLDPDGFVHILDLVLPERGAVGRWLAKNDRGEFARPLEHWRRLFTGIFEEVVFEPFVLKRLGIGFWHMIYFKGRYKVANPSR